MSPNTVSGMILASQGGNVGAGAVVTIGGISATTTAGGVYTMNTVPAGNEAVTISQSGYVNYSGNFVISSGINSNVNFTMTCNTVSGTILASQGGNVGAGAVVTIGGITATTTSGGAYTMNAVPAANDAVTIVQSGYVNYTGNVVISSGTNSNVNFTMTCNTVSGTILASQGGNVGSGAVVTIGGITATTTSGGNYTMNAVPAANDAVTIINDRLRKLYRKRRYFKRRKLRRKLYDDLHFGFRHNSFFTGRKYRLGCSCKYRWSFHLRRIQAGIIP